MYSIETGAASAREANSMHPLWKEYAFVCLHDDAALTFLLRYVFPVDPNDETIDLTADEQSFYFNEYSVE